MKDQSIVLPIDVDDTDLSESVREQISEFTEGLLDKFCKENNCTKDDVWESLLIEITCNIHKCVFIHFPGDTINL